MKEEALPVRDNHLMVASLVSRLTDLVGRVADLDIQMGGALATSNEADALTVQNRGSSSLTTIPDIHTRNTVITYVNYFVPTSI